MLNFLLKYSTRLYQLNRFHVSIPAGKRKLCKSRSTQTSQPVPHFKISILELAERVRSIAGSSSPIIRVPYAQAYPEGGFEDMRRRVPCICKIARLTGWAPHTTIDEMITHTIGYERRILSRPPPAALTLLPEPELTV